MKILEGKKILVTGVVNRHSIAFSIAERAQAQGAEVLLTSFGRVKRMTERSAARLDPAPDVLELDVNSDADVAALREELEKRWGTVDGAVHAIAFAPGDAIGGEFMATPRESAKVAFETSAYSLKSLAEAVVPLMGEGGALVGLDFDATVAWPSYDWMGVAKAALESTSRYLARSLGPEKVRVNLVSAGPIGSLAARSIPGFEGLTAVWNERAPLGWDIGDAEPAARAVVALLSDWFPATTGEILHVDGGVHAVGA